MRCAALLLLVLATATLVAHTEGGFWSTVKDFAKKNCGCSLANGKFSCQCKFGKRSLDKRGDGDDFVCNKDIDIDSVDDADPAEAMDKAIAKVMDECEKEFRRR